MYIHMYRDINIWNEKMNYFLFWVWTSSCCRMGRFDAKMAPYSTYKWYKNAWEIRCLKLHKGVKKRLIFFSIFHTSNHIWDGWFEVYILQWRYIECDGVSNHRRLDCLPIRLFRIRSKKTAKLRVTGLCEGIHRWPVDSPDKGPVMRKMFPFDDVTTNTGQIGDSGINCWYEVRFHSSTTVTCGDSVGDFTMFA